MMDIESESDQNEIQVDFEPLSLKTDKKLVLTREAQDTASNIHNRRVRFAQFNRALDSTNTAQRNHFNLKTKQFGTFEHFLTKNKHQGSKTEVFEVMRQLAQSKDHSLIGRVNDKLQKSKMILRVISKEKDGLVIVEDQTGREKMLVRNGTVWVGMIALMEVVWADNVFKLEKVHNLGQVFKGSASVVRQPAIAYRMLFVKGSFMKNDSIDNIGLKVLLNELRTLKERQRTRINCLVIMGPLLSSKNEALLNFCDRTFEEEAIELIKLVKDEVSKIIDDIEIIFMPATDDLNNYYPIPQPKDQLWSQVFQKNVHFTSNPGFIHLSGAKQNLKIDLMNVDLLSYIDENRTGNPYKNIMQENLQTYLMQPFFLTNTNQEPFDETNLPALYNDGIFGDIIVTSSRKNPPFATQVNGKVFMNIGCLGLDQQNITGKHYMTLVSIFDGTGPVANRTKVETLSM